ncbi:MAG: DUF2934 domain-containing protein [Alphaproteobacteria bacterium]|nr:DUF2934 domain-containing protein [Alphaproteobacteria bacterium]MBQ9234911.1 DUF2934 domain-containing protein [Alphaproteobacteria bacterium]
MYKFNEDAIREAAYYIWKNNGCQQGTSLSDWDAAINQLSAQAAFSVKMANKSSATLKKTASSTAKKTASLRNVKSIVLSPISALKSSVATKKSTTKKCNTCKTTKKK